MKGEGSKACPNPTGRHRSFRKRVSTSKDDLTPVPSLSSKFIEMLLVLKGTEILLNKYRVALSSIEQALILIKRYFDLERGTGKEDEIDGGHRQFN